MRVRGMDREGGGDGKRRGEEERRDPAEINQRILRSFLPLRDTLSLPLAVGGGVLS